MQMEEKIREKLEAAFRPTTLIIKNHSHLHAGHAGDDGSGESHFHLEIQSDALNDLSAVAGQRAIYDALAEEMRQIHALSTKILKTQ